MFFTYDHELLQSVETSSFRKISIYTINPFELFYLKYKKISKIKDLILNSCPRLLASGRLDAPSIYIPGYIDTKRKRTLSYRPCSVTDPNEDNKS